MQLATHNNESSKRAGTVPTGARISSFLKKMFGREEGGHVLPEPLFTPRIAPDAAKMPPPAAPDAKPVPSIRLLLKHIVDRFPTDLQGVVRKQPSDHVWIEIPRVKLEGQLARGAVKLTFAELRALTPDGFFSTTTAFDQHPVALPMDEILRQLKPARRVDQRQLDVPAHIAPLFNRTSQTAAPSGDAQNTEAWYSSMSKPTPHSVPDKKDPAPVSTPETGIAAAPAGAPAAASAVAPVQPPDHIVIPLALLADALPDSVKRDLGLENILRSTLSLPLRMLEPMVSRGKIVFEWKHLHSWIQTPVPVPMTCDVLVELPLAVIVPIFLGAKKSSGVRKRIAVDMSIPDLFAKSAVAPVPSPEEPAPAPRSSRRMHASAPANVSPAAGPMPVPSATSLRPHWMPDEIISHACEMESIAGAFIATHDGLLVAGQTPGFNERTVSAFAPTLFAQVKAYAQVTGLGQAESVIVMIGERAVQIFRCGKLYFGAVGRPGQPFPTAKLAKIAAQLQHDE